MDVVGLLEKSSAGHRYILVVSEYATRYPEAFPLRSITTPKIIHAPVQHFSRVGIPEEILTDRGTNFTSRLMGQLNKQLAIITIQTTPYHRRQTVLWTDLTKLSRTCCGSSLQTQDETGTSGYHLFSLLTERYPMRPRDSHRSSFYMDGRYKDPWTC